MDRSHRPHLLAFTGSIGAGKSTAAKALFPDYVKVSFADPLRTMLLAAGLCTVNDFLRKEEPLEWLPEGTPRRMLQTLGTEWGRNTISPRIWIALCERTVRQKLQQGMDVVVDDVRFNDEAEIIHRMGGVIIHISREGVNTSSDHSSERGIDRKWIDRIVYQPKEWTVEVLTEHLRELVYSFGGRPPDNG